MYSSQICKQYCKVPFPLRVRNFFRDRSLVKRLSLAIRSLFDSQHRVIDIVATALVKILHILMYEKLFVVYTKR